MGEPMAFNQAATTLAEVFAVCPVLFTMLRDGAAIDATLGRGTDALAAMLAGRTPLHMGTTAPERSALPGRIEPLRAPMTSAAKRCGAVPKALRMKPAVPMAGTARALHAGCAERGHPADDMGAVLQVHGARSTTRAGG